MHAFFTVPHSGWTGGAALFFPILPAAGGRRNPGRGMRVPLRPDPPLPDLAGQFDAFHKISGRFAAPDAPMTGKRRENLDKSLDLPIPGDGMPARAEDCAIPPGGFRVLPLSGILPSDQMPARPPGFPSIPMPLHLSGMKAAERSLSFPSCPPSRSLGGHEAFQLRGRRVTGLTRKRNIPPGGLHGRRGKTMILL